jgi:hypothetical protein
MPTKPVCVACQRFYRPKRNGTPFIESMPSEHGAAPPPGNDNPEAWAPYKLWHGDLWSCQGCGSEIIVGTGRFPLAEHFERDFAEQVAHWKPTITVNDC